MAASEAITDCGEYVVGRARHVIEHCGPRRAGSRGEAEALAVVGAELEEVADRVDREPFTVAPDAFFAAPMVVGVLLGFAAAAFWLSPWWAAAFSAAALAVYLFEVLLYREFLDPFFPRRQSANVVARLHPRGAARRRLILCGHIDAACEWRLLHRCPRAVRYLVGLGLLTLPAALAFDVASGLLALADAGRFAELRMPLGLLRAGTLPAAVLAVLFIDLTRVVPGANDDLSGVFLAVAMARKVHIEIGRLEETELVVLVTGSEEAGIRGAKDFVRRHAAELRSEETLVVALEILRDADFLCVYRRDRNGCVRHARRACRLLVAAAADRGVDLAESVVYLGATDAAAFSEVGIPATCLCAMDPAPAHYYHNRRDDWDNMDPACIEHAAEVLWEALLRFDRQGLGPAPGGRDGCAAVTGPPYAAYGPLRRSPKEV